jgi:hypothetical protein
MHPLIHELFHCGLFPVMSISSDFYDSHCDPCSMSSCRHCGSLLRVDLSLALLHPSFAPLLFALSPALLLPLTAHAKPALGWPRRSYFSESIRTFVTNVSLNFGVFIL